MRIRNLLPLVFAILLSTALSSRGAAQCSPPAPAVAKLRAYFSYYNRPKRDRHVRELFSVVTIGNRTFFRHNNPPSDFALDSYRTVYVYQSSQGLNTLACPADDTWVQCVGDWEPESAISQPKRQRVEPKAMPCEFELDVPEWKPSPESPQKRQLAVEILREVIGNLKYQEVYVRDFNIDDPNIDIYMVTEKGESEFQGCDFDRTKRPHCGWHMYGQAPRDSLKQHVMEQPYRLYPPPIGKP